MSLEAVIVGRPNVGKSTLFNRLVGKKLALVDDRPGVTRDRRTGQASIGGLKFTIVDTAGLDEAPRSSLEGRMRAQTEAAIDAADVCLFLIDARAGVTPLDRHFAHALRRHAKPVILLANKAEDASAHPGLHDAFELGLGEPIAISAEHGQGLDELYHALKGLAATPTDAPRELVDSDSRPERPLRLAIVGRPNVGKSTLVNSLLGEDRMLTGPEAGITRDAIASTLTFQKKSLTVWDTTGLRRKAKVTDKLEKLSVADALRAVRFAEVVMVVVDAIRPLEKQDLQIADLAAEEGRALVIAVNKWDLVEDKHTTLSRLRREVDEKLSQVRGVRLVPVSALRHEGLDALIQTVLEAYEVWNKRVSTALLNRWLHEMTERHPPPAPAGRRIKMRYMTQAHARPPTFAIFCSNAKGVPPSYRRYLMNGLRDKFDFAGVPIRINLRQTKNPYARRR
jgi:GTP-binding protein